MHIKYGHYIQSQQAGPLYVVPAIASFLGTKWFYYGEALYLQKDWVSRVSFSWPEVWANIESARYFGKHEGVDWGTYENNHPRSYFLYY